MAAAARMRRTAERYVSLPFVRLISVTYRTTCPPQATGAVDSGGARVRYGRVRLISVLRHEKYMLRPATLVVAATDTPRNVERYSWVRLISYPLKQVTG
jgi:hypothetical protein